MTTTARTATAAALALVFGVGLMLLLQANAPHHAPMFEARQDGPHSMTAMWGEMGWMTALGPVAGILFFGGIVTLVVMFVRFLVKSD